MTLSIRNDEADTLARRLAKIDGTSVTDAVIAALRQAIDSRTRLETPRENARTILARRGLVFSSVRGSVSQEVYHDLDHDLQAEG